MMNNKKRTWLKVFAIMLIAIISIGLLTQTVNGETVKPTKEEIPLETVSEEYIPSEKLVIIPMMEYIETDDIETVKQLIKVCEKQEEILLEYIDTYEEARIELAKTQELHDQYNYQLRKERWDDEYPVAAEVYNTLIENGYSAPVACGIIGNMMAEVGGQTLNLQYAADGNGYYGLCQWSMNYYPNVYGESVSGQMIYLLDTIEYAFEHYGNYTFSEFLQITNPAEAANAFARAYERCDPASYYQREINALTAFDYFT